MNLLLMMSIVVLSGMLFLMVFSACIAAGRADRQEEQRQPGLPLSSDH